MASKTTTTTTHQIQQLPPPSTSTRNHQQQQQHYNIIENKKIEMQLNVIEQNQQQQHQTQPNGATSSTSQSSSATAAVVFDVAATEQDDHQDDDSVVVVKPTTAPRTTTATTQTCSFATTHHGNNNNDDDDQHHFHDVKNSSASTTIIVNNNNNGYYGYYSSSTLSSKFNNNNTVLSDNQIHNKNKYCQDYLPSTKKKRLEQLQQKRRLQKYLYKNKNVNKLNGDDVNVNDLFFESSFNNNNNTKQRMTTNSHPDLSSSNAGADEDADRTRRSRSRTQAAATASVQRQHHQRMTNVTASTTIPKSSSNNQSTSSSSIMNLRNRALKMAAKAASADISNNNHNPVTSHQNDDDDISSSKTFINSNDNESSAATANRRRRRRSQRRQQTQVTTDKQSESADQKQTQQTTSLPVTTRSIRSFFPLRTIGDVCELFRSQLGPQFETTRDTNSDNDSPSNTTTTKTPVDHCEPDLALLSIVIGIIETSMTKIYDSSSTTATELNITKIQSSDSKVHSSTSTSNIQSTAGSYSPAEATPAPIVAVTNVIHTPLDIPIPTVYYENVESLLKKFSAHIKESIDLSKYPKHKTTRELLKKISEVIWSNLYWTHSKDRAHSQTIYTYMTEQRLDCYGVAYTVLAACQILGLDDVRLVMSEDHAWVIFGEGETCEVTWHGKSGNDERFGQPISENINCWLYLNGNTMVCDRFLTVATLVSAMNLSINATQDSQELAILQQQLLWILYDYGYLQRYPMALGNLADLHDLCLQDTLNHKKHPVEIFHEAIDSAKKYYNDYHVYPYTYIGGYYFRNGRFKEAFKSWADAAQVIKKYNYTRDDEEIYKEFQEIANDLIPNIMKYSTNNENSVLYDPECFVHLLRLYDGLCAWEEDSTTPVLHIGWTKPIVSTISKFPYSTRSQVSIKVNYHLNEKMNYSSDDEDLENNGGLGATGTTRERRRRRAASTSSTTTAAASSAPTAIIAPVENKMEKMLENGKNHHSTNDHEIKKSVKKEFDQNDANSEDNNNNNNNASNKTIAILTSKKFAGIKNLLTADKLNTSAIQLQLTAQSQVNVNKRHRNSVGAKSGSLTCDSVMDLGSSSYTPSSSSSSSTTATITSTITNTPSNATQTNNNNSGSTRTNSGVSSTAGHHHHHHHPQNSNNNGIVNHPHHQPPSHKRMRRE